jgi:hypothetical protein
MSCKPLPTRVGILFVLCILSVGCEDSDSTSLTSGTQVTTSRTNQRSELEQGLSFLSRLEEFEAMQAHQKIQYHLQQWLKAQKAIDGWSVDPMVAQLPARFRPLASSKRLGLLEFEPYDIQMLQEATWMRDVVGAVLQQNQVPPGLEQKIQAAIESLDDTAGSDLSLATKLFDWTVRNLLLDADIGPGDTQRSDEPTVLQGWESLMMGRGTAEEKARVFILLTRQVGLHVIMLAIDQGENQVPRSWLPALLIGDQLYLFDMRLGVPLPGSDGKSFATLEDLIDHPEMLDTLAERSGVPYTIETDDLSRVVALIDATPGYLSQRMQLLQGVLVGDQKTVLTVAPTPLAEKLSASRGINGVGIWSLPYEGFIMRSSLTAGSNSLLWLAIEHQLFDRKTPLHEARLLHFRGQYDPVNENPGARQFYMSCRTPDAQIKAIRNKPLEVPEGYREPTEEELVNYQRRLNALGDLMVRTKQNASFWLGLIAFDRGEFSVAVDYFDQRVVSAFPDGIWTSAARYNLGRSYEALARQDDKPEHWKNAVEVYRSVKDSPWTAACRWRASAIKQEQLSESTAED